MEPDAIPKVALRWTSEGTRRRGRPRQTWRRTVEAEMREKGKIWAEIQRLANNRDQWKILVAALTRHLASRAVRSMTVTQATAIMLLKIYIGSPFNSKLAKLF